MTERSAAWGGPATVTAPSFFAAARTVSHSACQLPGVEPVSAAVDVALMNKAPIRNKNFRIIRLFTTPSHRLSIWATCCRLLLSRHLRAQTPSSIRRYISRTDYLRFAAAVAHSQFFCLKQTSGKAHCLVLAISRAISTIMSSWPPTMRRAPASTRMARVSTL
jgi:hypothetical protein